MKNLILIRHAKSSWDLPISDFDRTLTVKGVQDAHKVSTEAINFLPKSYLIWSSDAKRAQETAKIFAQNFSYPIEKIVFKHELYTFEEKKLESIINTCSMKIDNLIVFGHNDAITNFVNKFGSIFITNVSTSGLVSIQFNINDWMELKTGLTEKVIFPKGL